MSLGERAPLAQSSGEASRLLPFLAASLMRDFEEDENNGCAFQPVSQRAFDAPHFGVQFSLHEVGPTSWRLKLDSADPSPTIDESLRSQDFEMTALRLRHLHERGVGFVIGAVKLEDKPASAARIVNGEKQGILSEVEARIIRTLLWHARPQDLPESSSCINRSTTNEAEKDPYADLVEVFGSKMDEARLVHGHYAAFAEVVQDDSEMVHYIGEDGDRQFCSLSGRYETVLMSARLFVERPDKLEKSHVKRIVLESLGQMTFSGVEGSCIFTQEVDVCIHPRSAGGEVELEPTENPRAGIVARPLSVRLLAQMLRELTVSPINEFS